MSVGTRKWRSITTSDVTRTSRPVRGPGKERPIKVGVLVFPPWAGSPPEHRRRAGGQARPKRAKNGTLSGSKYEYSLLASRS